MSENVSGADNQQGSSDGERRIPSETIRRAPVSKKEIRAYFQGALHDASYNKNSRFRFSQKGKQWLSILKLLLARIGYNSWIYKEGKNRHVYVLETLANFLDFNFNPLCLETDLEQRSYIRGFFDAEGGIPHKRENRFYIQLAQKNKEKLRKIKKILAVLKIQTGKIHNPSKAIDPKYWRMYVLTNSHELFIKRINSWHPIKIKIFNDRMKI